MTEELTLDHSVRRWVAAMLDKKFGDVYRIDYDVYTGVDAKWNKTTEIRVDMFKKHLVRGGKSRPPITYRVTVENWTNPQEVANKVVTALLLMEEGDAA